MLNVQNTCLTETGKVISDECSILRTEMLTGWFSYYHPITNRSKWKLSRKKLSDIEKFLQKTRHGPYDNNWLRHARKAYKASLMYDIKVFDIWISFQLCLEVGLKTMNHFIAVICRARIDRKVREVFQQGCGNLQAFSFAGRYLSSPSF